jgi:hypothetical protein
MKVLNLVEATNHKLRQDTSCLLVRTSEIAMIGLFAFLVSERFFNILKPSL